MLINVVISQDRNVIKKQAEKILKQTEKQCMQNVETKAIPSNWDKWNHFKLIQKIPEPHTQKAQNKGTTENSHIGHCTHTLESTIVKVQNIFNMQSYITCSINLTT